MALARPWYRVISVPSATRASSPEWDFVAVLPAALSAAQRRRPFVVGWFSRGGGAPLELITNAGPVAFSGGLDELNVETSPHSAPHSSPYSGPVGSPHSSPYSGPVGSPHSSPYSGPFPSSHSGPSAGTQTGRHAAPEAGHSNEPTARPNAGPDAGHDAGPGSGPDGVPARSFADPADAVTQAPSPIGMLFPNGARGALISDELARRSGSPGLDAVPGQAGPAARRTGRRGVPARLAAAHAVRIHPGHTHGSAFRLAHRG